VIPQRCTLVIPDSGPLISLYRANSLDVLLTLDMPIILVDEVVAEVAAKPDQSDQDATIAAFITTNDRVVKIARTDVGDDQVALRQAGLHKSGRNMGEAAIADFMAKTMPQLIKNNAPVLLLYEDGDVKGKRMILPNNVHLLSTVGMLKGMERAGIIASSEVIIEAMIKSGRRFGAPRDETDLPVEMGSYWISPKVI
jgi:predicted nucleic acid-binding protein